jgi:hypothetical protein
MLLALIISPSLFAHCLKNASFAARDGGGTQQVARHVK